MTPFFIHVDRENLQISGISAQKNFDPKFVNIEVEEQTGIDFLSGTELVTDWYVYKKDDAFFIAKIDKTKFVTSRLALSKLKRAELKQTDADGVEQQYDVVIKQEQDFLIFNFFLTFKAKLLEYGNIKFYLTGHDDITDLKFTIEFSDDIMFKLFDTYNEYEWDGLKIKKPKGVMDVYYENPNFSVSLDY